MVDLPAHLKNRQSKTVADSLVANLGTGSPPYVSINGNRFTLIDATGEEEPVPTYDPKTGPYLDCVVIDNNEHTSKIFYDTKYDPNAEGQAPACFSDNGIAPSRQAAKPQSALCATCQWNVWGSATSNLTGKQIKACHDVQKIAVMIPGDEVVFLMRVQPGSRKNFGAYVLKFKGSGADISDVITRISFESQGVLTFRAIDYIKPEVAQQREQVLAEKKTDALIGRGDIPIQTVGTLQPVMLPPSQPSPLPVAALPQQTIATPVAPVAPVSASEQPTTRRRRRTAAAQEPSQAPPTQAPFMSPQPQGDGVPEFLQRNPAPPPVNPTPFGIGPGVAPNPEVKAAIDSIFNTK